MKQALIYSLKVWLTTTTVSAVIGMTLQSVFLDPDYHPFSSHFAIDWFFQLGCMFVADLIFLLPMATMAVLVVMQYIKRRAPRKIWLYLTIAAFAILPNLILIQSQSMHQSLKQEVLSASGGGFLLNGLTCALVAVVCVKLYPIRVERSVTNRN